MIHLQPMDKLAIQAAQRTVTEQHYLHKPIDTRSSIEGYWIYSIHELPGPLGLFLLGRPEATKVKGWYGGREPLTYWQVLNLARVWFHPNVQRGGSHYGPEWIPGFTDRRGVWRSTLASDAIKALVQRVAVDYLLRRPPVFLDEPYRIEWLLSYCDTKLHKGTIYRAAGFERYRINANGIETWRIQLPAITLGQHLAIRKKSRRDARANRYRAQRGQQRFEGLGGVR